MDITARYEEAMYRLEAVEYLGDMFKHDWPNLKKEKRQIEHRRIHRIAYPNIKRRGLTLADIAKLDGMGKI